LDKLEIIERVKVGIGVYEQIINREIHYVYKKDNEYCELITRPEADDFMHLTGVLYEGSLPKTYISATYFYKLFKNTRSNRLNLNKIIEKEDGCTPLKLAIIDQLTTLLTCKTKIIDEEINYINFVADSGIRDTNKQFCLGLFKDTEFYTPKSLLKMSTFKRGDIQEGDKVQCVFEKLANGAIQVLDDEIDYQDLVASIKTSSEDVVFKNLPTEFVAYCIPKVTELQEIEQLVDKISSTGKRIIKTDRNGINRSFETRASLAGIYYSINDNCIAAFDGCNKPDELIPFDSLEQLKFWLENRITELTEKQKEQETNLTDFEKAEVEELTMPSSLTLNKEK
jgi:hypothetical protein